MKQILLFLSLLLLTGNIYSQNYYHTSGTQTTCRGQYFSSNGGPSLYGSTGGYSNNEDITETFCSGTGGQIRANFYWVDLQTGSDILYIYDGPTTASPLLGTLTGTSYYPGVFTSSGTCLTFRFISNGSTRWGGWQAFLGCSPQSCGTNAAASDECGSAPVICNLDGYCGSTSGWFTRDHGNIEGTTWGGNGSFSCGSIQNNSWISFVATGTTANFNITSSGCSDPSTGIQAVVFAQAACTTFTAKSSCQSNGIGTFALNATGLTAGQTYYIMVDGVDGNDCDYIVQAQSGVQTVNITSTGSTKCVGSAFTLTASASGTGPFSYSWTPTPNSGQGTTVATYTANSSTTYSCIITGACGASQTATYYQTINPSPIITVAGTQTICSGNSTTLTAASSSTGNVTFNNNQTYSIPDNNTTGVTSTISVTGISGTVGSNLASVCLNITHGFDADVDIILTCPGGTTVDLSSDNGGSGDNYTNTCFVNSGTSITLGTAPFTGSFTPEQALSTLSGCAASGTWSLTVKDDASLDAGTLNSWTLNFTNGTSYSWSPSSGLSSTTGSVVVANPTTTTVYSITGTDMGGCSGTKTVTITVNPTPTVAITSTPSTTLCLGSSITFSAATANTYTWTNPTNGGLSSTSGANVSAIPTATGSLTYTVNASSAVGCTTTAVRTITVNPVPTANAGTGGTLTCTTTTLSLSGSGGGTYAWSGPGILSGASSANPVVNMPGTYSLTVTNTSGCSSPVSTVAVTQNTTAPSVAPSVSGILNCTLTSVNTIATTTSTPVSYTWTGTGITAGAGTATATVNQPGTFNYTVTNTSNGCKTTGSQAVTQNTTAPTVTVSGTQTITCAAPTVTLTGSATPSTCTPVWTGGVASGANSYTATASSSNVYTLTVTNPANGCTASTSTTVSPSAGLPILNTPVISNSITCLLSTAQITLSSTPAGNTYAWSGPGIVSGASSSVVTVSVSGTYSAVVTNTASLCSSSVTAFVPLNTTPPTPGASNSTTLTCSTTTAALTGTGGGTYSWAGPGILSGGTTSNPTINMPGTYTVTVTSSVNGCTATANTTVSQNTTAPIPGASNSTTLTCSTTTAALTGTGGGTYSWAGPGILSGGTTSNPTINMPGTYTVTVTSSVNGCTATANTTVSQNTTAPIPGASNSTTLTCSTTTAALTGTGGGTYSWAGPGILSGGTTSNPTINMPGTYTVTVTSSVNGCTATANTTVSQNTTAPTPTATTGGTLTCTTASVTLTGTPSSGLTYQWSGAGLVGATTNSTAIANLAGTYTLLVTSTINSCTNTATTIVGTDYSSPNTTATNNTTLTCATTTALVTGGPLSGVTYQWSGPGIVGATNTQTILVNAPGAYNLIAISAVTGCSNTAQTIVDQNVKLPNPTATPSGTLTCSVLTISIAGTPTTAVTYTWSGPGIVSGTNNSNVIVNAPGNYSLTVRDAVSSCTNVADVSVVQNTVVPSVAGTSTGSLNCTTTNVNVSATTTTTPVSYNWSGTGITSAANISTITVNQGGVFTYTVTNTANNCTTTNTVAVTQNIALPSVTMPSTQTITCSSPSVSLIGSANPSTCTPVWTGGVCAGTNSYTASACSPSTYTLTVTNPFNGCTISGTVAVVASVGVPSVTASNTGSITCLNTSSQITASTTMTPVTYSWTGPGSITGASSSTGTVNVGGSYQCIVTNTLTGCSSTITTIVPTNTTPVTASISPTSSITCTTTSLTLNSSPTGSYSYSWTPSSGLSGSSVSTPTVTQGGVYSVTITNTVNGCFGNTNITVPSNTVNPNVLISSSSVTTSCSNPSATLSITATPSTGVTYSWTAPGSGSLNTYTISNPIASGSGVFTVVVTNTASGCTSSLTQNTVQVIPDLAIPQTTLSTNSLSITCTNTTPSVSITTTASPVSYSWSPTSGIVAGTQTSSTPSFSAPGSYSVVVTNTNTGCATSITGNIVNVTLDNTIPTVTLTSATNNGTLTCLTTSISITPTVSPSSNLTYSWSPSTGISSTTNQSSATFTAAGVYTLAITNTVNGCASSATNTANSFTVIADNTPPTFTLGTAPSVTTTCAAPNATLSATSNADPTAVYTWTTPTSSTVTGNPINTAAAGIYTVAVTNTVNGCNSSATSTNTVEVIVDAGIPNITLSVNSLSITCSNPTPSVSVSTTATPVSYSWSPTSGIVAGTETTANPSFNAAGSYSVVVTNTNSGCATDVTTNVVTVTLDNTVPVILPFVGAINSGTINCNNSSVTASPFISPNTDLTYTWSPTGTGLSTPTNQANATFTASGVYTLAVTNTLTGCVSVIDAASTFTVVVDTLRPVVAIIPTSTNTVIGCGASNATVTLDGSSSTSANPSPILTWLPTNTSGTSLPVTTSGTYTLVVTDAVSGCSNTAQYFVDGNTTIPTVDAGTSAGIACGSSSVALNGITTSTNVNYSWSGPSSTSISSGNNTATPIVIETGTYTLTVTDNLTGCQNTATVIVSQTNVTASFTANPTSGLSPLTVNFTDQSIGANTWNWNFGDSNSSNSQNPINTFNTGTYTVTLTASTGSCVSTATLLIVVEDGLTLEIPNVFTPNGDNVNDIFTIKSTGVKEITLQIFNRWGEKLYEFAGSKASWDGITPNGGKAPEGTYFFFVKATGYDDKTIEQHGTLTLFR